MDCMDASKNISNNYVVRLHVLEIVLAVEIIWDKTEDEKF